MILFYVSPSRSVITSTVVRRNTCWWRGVLLAEHLHNRPTMVPAASDIISTPL